MKIRLERHAAHYHGGGGHDLEWITLECAVRPTSPALPHGFEWHSGSKVDGIQRWYYCRKAPLSAGRCPRCPIVVVPGVWRVDYRYRDTDRAAQWCAIKAPSAEAARAKFTATDRYGHEVLAVVPFTEDMKHGLALAD